MYPRWALCLSLGVVFLLNASLAQACGNYQCDDLITQINQWRADLSLPALRCDPRLVATSFQHSADMATNSIFGPTGSDGSTPPSRMAAAGYAHTFWGEGLGAGYPTADQIAAAWRADATYYIMTEPELLDIGCGVALGGPYAIYWTVDVGRDGIRS